MLPLFRKNKDKAPAPAAQARPAEPAPDQKTKQGPNSISGLEPERHYGSDPGIQVQEGGALMPAELEEAAVLYANGKVGEAAALLNRFLLDHPKNRDPQPWYMLFDLYEVTGQRQPFEDAALDFAVKFERSPPTWAPVIHHPEPRKQRSMPIFAFGPSLSVQDKTRLQHFLKEAAQAEAVTLDLSKAMLASPEYAMDLLSCITALADKKKPVKLEGAQAFLVRLNAAKMAGKLEEPGWLVMLALLQLLGEADQFDEMAVEFAVRFEISPPSYTPPRPLPQHLEEEEASGPSGFEFPLRGVLGSHAANVMSELRAFAEKLPRAEVDMSQLERIEFGSVGMVLETLIALQQKGCKVLLKNGNEMVNVLLQIVGANQFATLIPKARKN